MSDLAAAQSELQTVFGFVEFRPGQAEIVSAILDGRDVLAVMPTGSGKSLCYQLPALVRDGLTVVVSPLIALMRNQVAQLNANGIAAASLNSANDAADNRAIIDKIARRELRLVYVAPERLLKSETLALFKRANVALLAVDEAHCISQWGHDFRPEYAALGTVQAELGGVQTAAFTATADAATRTDILDKLFVRPPALFVHGFDRPNLRLAMCAKAGGRKQIASFIDGRRGQSGIVYCASRRKTEELADFLRASGIHALPYHAGMESAARARNQDAFLQEDGAVVVATVAFGMGIDKPDVRFVLHADMPATIESYYQDVGANDSSGLTALFRAVCFRPFRFRAVKVVHRRQGILPLPGEAGIALHHLLAHAHHVGDLPGVGTCSPEPHHGEAAEAMQNDTGLLQRLQSGPHVALDQPLI